MSRRIAKFGEKDLTAALSVPASLKALVDDVIRLAVVLLFEGEDVVAFKQHGGVDGRQVKPS